jgi:hypothetical protein
MWLAAGNWRLALISRILLADSNSLSSSEAITNTVNNLKMVLIEPESQKTYFLFSRPTWLNFGEDKQTLV